MTRWIILVVTVIVLTAAATFMMQNSTNSERGPIPIAVNESKGPQPKVEIATPLVYDFGTMSQLRKDSHTWEIKNVGDADLEIWLDHSTCSCTIAKLAAEPEMGDKKPHVHVKPKQTTPITLEFETKTFQNKYEKGAWIGSNDPSRPLFSLFVTGVVFPPVNIFPSEPITLNGISNEEETTATIAVFSMDMPSMKITRLSTGRPALIEPVQSPLVKEQRQRLKVPAGGYRVDLKIKPGMPLGRFSDELVIETDHPLQKETRVSIHGYTTGPISVNPDRVRLTGVSGPVGATTSLNLHVRGGKAINFQIDKKPAILNVTIEPVDDPNQKGRYRLTVAVPPGTPHQRIEGEIVIKTDHPRAAEIRIPVMILVSDSTSA